ncbi:MAG: EamA family transporter [Gemmatimonas sp.]
MSNDSSARTIGANSTATGAAAVLGATVSMLLGAAFAKRLFPLVGAYGITALRVTLAATLLLLLHRPRRRPVKRELLPSLIGYGVTIGLMNLLFYQAIARIPIGIATGIEVTGPLAIVLLGSRKPRDFALLLAAVTGLLLLLPVDAGQALDPVGVLFAFGAAAGWAFYIVAGKRVSAVLGNDAVAWGMTVSAMFTFPIGFAASGTAMLAPDVLLLGLGVACISSVIPYTLEMLALQRLPKQVFGLFLSASPAVAALVGWVVLNESLSAVQWLASLLIVGASAGSALGAASPAHEADETLMQPVQS